MPAATKKANGLILVGGQWMPEGAAPEAAPKGKPKKKSKGSSPKAKALLETLRAMQTKPDLASIVRGGEQLIAGAAEGWVTNLNRKKLLGAYAIALRTFAAMAEQ